MKLKKHISQKSDIAINNKNYDKILTLFISIVFSLIFVLLNMYYPPTHFKLINFSNSVVGHNQKQAFSLKKSSQNSVYTLNQDFIINLDLRHPYQK